jgi:hypothetical protein
VHTASIYKITTWHNPEDGGWSSADFCNGLPISILLQFTSLAFLQLHNISLDVSLTGGIRLRRWARFTTTKKKMLCYSIYLRLTCISDITILKLHEHFAAFIHLLLPKYGTSLQLQILNDKYTTTLIMRWYISFKLLFASYLVHESINWKYLLHYSVYKNPDFSHMWLSRGTWIQEMYAQHDSATFTRVWPLNLCHWQNVWMESMTFVQVMCLADDAIMENSATQLDCWPRRVYPITFMQRKQWKSPCRVFVIVI